MDKSLEENIKILPVKEWIGLVDSLTEVVPLPFSLVHYEMGLDNVRDKDGSICCTEKSYKAWKEAHA